ncbi:MAG TPA: nucleotidyltransferase family protein [Pyrinomonadaceae bacterium]|nr:nucleotidyltransferase family protein [Pyrinomonadaceae bacterium]
MKRSSDDLMSENESKSQLGPDASDHSREIRFIIDCSRTAVPEAAASRISAALAEPIDWKFVLNVAQRNAVLPLLGRTLIQGFSKQLPADIKASLESEQECHLRHNLLQTRELLEMVKFFGANGITVLPFKGPMLAIEAYGDPSYRKFNDLDVLVQPKQFHKAVALLTEKGWEPLTSVSWLTKRNWSISRKKDIYFVSPERNVNLELHWKLSGSHFGLPKEINTLWERLGSIVLAGTPVRTLGITDLLIYLCLHGSRHSWERFGWICDVHELILSKECIDWDQLFIASRRAGTENVVAFGLRLITDLFEFEVPDERWKTVISSPMFAEMSAETKNRLFAAKAQHIAIGDRYLDHLRLKERAFDRIKLHFHYLSWYLRIIFTPNEADRNVLALPQALAPLHYVTRPIRLFYKYALRPRTSKPRHG